MNQLDKEQDDRTLLENANKQLSILNTSSYYIHILVVAILLSFETLDIKRQQILCSVSKSDDCDCLPSMKPYQFTSSLMTIISANYFFDLSKDTYCQASSSTTGRAKNKLNYTASLLLLIASILRILDLFVDDANSSL